MMRLIACSVLASFTQRASITCQPRTAQGLGEVEEYGYDGFLEPAEDVLVSAVEIGRLESVKVKVGDRVEAGQVDRDARRCIASRFPRDCQATIDS
jgi:multidrug efflux pump subunit AcrA (membrane-fusion protein)